MRFFYVIRKKTKGHFHLHIILLSESLEMMIFNLKRKLTTYLLSNNEKNGNFSK